MNANISSNRKGKLHTRGFTLMEMMIAMTITALVFSVVADIFAAGTRQYALRASENIAMRQAASAFDRMTDDIRNAVRFSSGTVSGNPVYTFILPANTDVSGNYIPNSAGLAMLYAEGARVRYYLSNSNGEQTTTGGTVLWRATATSTGSVWTKDTAWTKDAGGRANCDEVQTFTMAAASDAVDTVDVTLAVRSNIGVRTGDYTIRRRVVMINNNTAGMTYSVNSQASFLQSTNDPASPNPLTIDLQACNILPGDTIRITNMGGFSYVYGIADNSFNGMNYVFSSSSTVTGPMNAQRVPGRISCRQPTAITWNSSADCAEDFMIWTTYADVVVPIGARYFIVGTVDSFLQDNSDADGNYQCRIQKL